MTATRGLEWWRDVPGGVAWLESLPSVVDACAERWSLTIGPAFEGQNVSHIRAAELPDGTRAVLKINFPELESEYEPDALRLWDGRGAVRLLGYEESMRALLLERCEPGTPLWAVEDDEEATRIAAEALRRMWRPAPDGHRFRSLREEAALWAGKLPADWEALGGPFERRLIDEAVAACLELGPDQVDEVVLHQDFHGGNLLRAEREPWLVIDPKPLVGERELEASGLLRNTHDVSRWLDVLLELGFDRERARGWGVAHNLAWAWDERRGWLEQHLEEARRILNAR